MKYIACLICSLFMAQSLLAQGERSSMPPYPTDPDIYYNFSVVATPRSGGGIDSNVGAQVAPNTKIELSASANDGYKFVKWTLDDGTTLSSDAEFIYTMPEKNVVLTAHFEFNPETPPDPFVDGYQHKVVLAASPAKGGYFNYSSTFNLAEGESTEVYAYPRSGYRFESWMQGQTVISTDNPLEIIMGTEDMAYTAVFSYQPMYPDDPDANSFDVSTGLLIIDSFQRGGLYSAISRTLGQYSTSDVKSILVSGSMNSSDFGFAYEFTNCETIDLSRTSGFSKLPAYAFEGLSVLKEMYLPSCVEQIGNNAFSGCSNIETIYCYATIPPSLSDKAMTDLPNTVTIRVPSSAVSLYLNADGWKDFSIKPLLSDEVSLTINLPSGISIDDYKNMNLELVNVISGQRTIYVITNRTAYTFMGLVKNTAYKAYIRDARGNVLGEIADISVGTQDVAVTFTSLKKVVDIALSVIDKEGTDVSDKVNITWLNADGIYLCQGKRLPQTVEGTVLQYSIRLPDDLALLYQTPSNVTYAVKADNTKITYNLIPISEVLITGTIKDGHYGNGISGVTVSISQKINSKLTKTVTGVTDKDGIFGLTAYSLPFTLAVSGTNYVNQSINVDEPAIVNGVVDAGTLKMTSIVGASVDIKMHYYKNIKAGEDESVQNYYSDYANITWSIFNNTTQKNVAGVSVRYPSLVMMSDVNIGDSLTITATSRKNAFLPAISGLKISGEANDSIVFNIKQLGQIEASFGESENTNIVGIIYDDCGRRVSCHDYIDTAFISEGLQDGNYSLVTMAKSDKYNTLYYLTQLFECGMLEGKDYEKTAVKVESGRITETHCERVPVFDESHLAGIVNSTTFTGNKSSLIVGNYLALSAQIEIPLDELDAISDYCVFVDLPETVEYVQGSLMVGSAFLTPNISGKRLAIPLTKLQVSSKIKFCVVPTIVGNYIVNAFFGYMSEGKQRLVPMSSVYFEGKDLEITVPKQTATTDFRVSGTVAGTADIEIYDNDVLIGNTCSAADGSWICKVQLNQAYNLSTHEIYAKVKYAGGIEVLSETKSCFYNKNEIFPLSVTMTFFNTYYKKNITVVFDQQEGTTSDKSYMMNSSNAFTFIADLTCNNPDVVSAVYFYIYRSDGNITKLAASYDENLDKWVATSNFHTQKAPINIAVECIADVPVLVDREVIEKKQDFIQDVAEQNVDEHLESLIAELENAMNNQDEALCDQIMERIQSYLGIDGEVEIEENYELDKILAQNDSLLNVMGDYSIGILENDTIDMGDGNYAVYSTGKLSESTISTDLFADSTRVKLSDETSMYIVYNDNDLILADSIKDLYYRFQFITNPVFYHARKSKVTSRSDSDDNRTIVFERAKILWDNICRFGSFLTTGGDLVNKKLFFVKLKGQCQELKKTFGDYLESYQKLQKSECEKLVGEWVRNEKARKFIFTYNDRMKVLKKQIANARVYSRILKCLGPIGAIFDFNLLMNQIDETLELMQDVGDVCQKICNCQNLNTCKAKEKEWENLVNEASHFYDTSFEQLRNNAYINTAAFVGNLTALVLPYVTKNAVASLYIGTSSVIVGSVGTLKDVANKASIENRCGILSAQNYNLVVRKCEDDKEDEDGDSNNDGSYSTVIVHGTNEYNNSPKPASPNTTEILDPSGFVYEGVPSNRVAGVTASCYYKEITEDMFGDPVENVILWNAEEYSQVNPLFTDENGYYRWDVPQGLWQVKYEKDGYMIAYSDWLPVPPPQLEVNIGIVQNKQPQVTEVHAYVDAVEINFDKYMSPKYLTTDYIFVTIDGEKINGEIVLLDDETSLDNKEEHYASSVRFVPTEPFEVHEIQLTVSNKVRSYADIPMQETFTQTFDIEQELRQLIVPEEVNVGYGQSKQIQVIAVPMEAVAGKTLNVVSTSEIIATVDCTSVPFDEDGIATIIVTGQIIGTAVLNFSVADSKTTASMKVNVAKVPTIKVPSPVPSIASGSTVESGTELYFSCDMEGVSIYYTLDGSCPCGDDRILYDGKAIILTENVTIKAMGVAEDGTESEVVTFYFIVEPIESGIGNVSVDDVAVRPTLIRNSANVLLGGKTALSIQVIDVNGIVHQTYRDITENLVVDFSSLSSGMYFVVINMNGHIITKKVVKIR